MITPLAIPSYFHTVTHSHRQAIPSYGHTVTLSHTPSVKTCHHIFTLSHCHTVTQTVVPSRCKAKPSQGDTVILSTGQAIWSHCHTPNPSRRAITSTHSHTVTHSHRQDVPSHLHTLTLPHSYINCSTVTL
jgi:hypothetical protein